MYRILDANLKTHTIEYVGGKLAKAEVVEKDIEPEDLADIEGQVGELISTRGGEDMKKFLASG